jgi:ATP-dependent DNA ligase
VLSTIHSTAMATPSSMNATTRCTELPTGFIAPCLPTTTHTLPSGGMWLHEIKHDGYRLMARRDSVGTRLLTRNGHDWAPRYPLIVEAVNRLKVRSCLIDGEAVACDENGLAVFERLRRKPSGKHVFLYAFDLVELNGQDLRREPLETRKATLASLLRGGLPGLPPTPPAPARWPRGVSRDKSSTSLSTRPSSPPSSGGRGVRDPCHWNDQPL